MMTSDRVSTSWIMTVSTRQMGEDESGGYRWVGGSCVLPLGRYASTITHPNKPS
jgi:hypothetical protein